MPFNHYELPYRILLCLIVGITITTINPEQLWYEYWKNTALHQYWGTQSIPEDFDDYCDKSATLREEGSDTMCS